MSPLRAASLVVFSLVSFAACGDDSTGPTPASVAGTYDATRIDVTFAGSSQPTDALALGFSAVIVLTAQGTTSGTLVVPAEFTEDGIDDDVIDLTGTFTVSGNTLTFSQGDDILRELPPWTIGNGTLTSVRTDAEGTIEVTLTRIQP
jgi:hypothetical protein